MASDPLDQLQSIFPTIDGDVIAIVFSESDKDVSSTVEKLLQLVPTNESDKEFPSLQSTVQRSQPRGHSLYQAISPPSHQPDRSSSGPAATGNSTLTGQRGNRRLQGPTHIPPAVDRNQQLKNLTGNEFGGGLRVAPQQRVQQNPYQQSHQSKAYGQTNLGKGTAPGNQRRAGGGTNTAGGHGNNVPLHGHGQQKPPQVQGGFYQLGGTAVNSMPTLSAALEPNSYFYHQALQPPQQRGATTSNMQQQALQHQYQLQPQSHSHSKFQPQSHSQVQAQAQYRAQQQQQQAQRMGTGNGMYGYSGLRPNDPLLASWMNSSSRRSDFSNSTNAKNGQFYPTLQQPGQHQNWPNVMDGGGKTANLQQYHQQQQQNPNPLPYGGSGGYPLQAPVSNSLLGSQSDQSRKSDWSMYSVAGSSSSGGGGDERGNMDAISALLLQPERAMTSSSSSSISSSDFGRYGHIQSEPSLSKLQTTNVHHRGHNSGGAAPGNKVDPHGRKTGVNSGSSGAATQSGKGSGGSEVKGDGGSKKLIILRGLPGSGKTTLARSRVGSSGVICCTDDFFMNNGEYVFDPSLLEENHEKNKRKARDAMKSGCSPVIIDNTNTNAWEMKPYVLLAMEHGYAVEILEPDTPWRFKTAELTRRNSHGVPRQSLEKMLERYDHRVTLESIIVSQPPERKPKPTDSEPSRASSGGNGGQSANTSGQYRERGRTTKMSPTTPRHQHGGGAYETDHTHHSKQQNRSSQLSPRPGRRDQRSNDSSGGGGRVSPRPTNQRGQRSSKDNSGRNGNEQYHPQNHHFGTSSASESSAGHVSVIGEGRPSSSDTRKKTTPTSSNQHQHQSTQQSQAVSMASVYSNKSQNDQFSRAKGRRTTAQQQQQAGSKSTLGTTTAASNKKRSMSPSPRGPGASSSSKQNSQIVGGRENGHRRREYGDRAVGNGHVGQKRSGGRESAGEGKKSRRGTEEDMDDEFLWDSSEETEILDTDEGVGGGGGEGDLRNGPIFMTDEPPKNASFRPVPQVGKAMMNGITVSGGIGINVKEGKRVPIFDVWKDSDDEDIDDSNEGEAESPIPIPVVREGQGGQQQHALQRTVEVANVSDKTNVDVFEPPSVDVIQAPPSHPWERTQSARDLQEVNDHFTSLIRRVQSANPTQPLSTLSESDGSQSVINSSDETFNVFTMSSVWGSQSGLLGSKIQLYFGEDADSKLRVDRIDSLIKSYSSLRCSDSSESQLEKQKKAQSFYSMLDALAEELPATTDKVQSKEIDDGIDEHKIRGVDSLGEEKVRRVRSKLLDEAVQGTQSSLTIQEAIEDEAKCPLRNKLIKELLTENISVRGKNKRTLESVIESASDVLETNVDIETLLPEHTLESDLSRTSLPPPVKTDASVADVNDTPLKGAMVSFVADSSFEEGCSIEAFTDKVFVEEKPNPQQNFQAAFQIIAQKAILEQRPSSFAKIDKEREKESFEESTESTFEDPAIVSKVCLAGESATNLKKLPTSEGNQSALLEKEENKSLPVPSPEQLEPLDVFPSAFDEGLATSFPPSSAAAAPLTETADKSQSTTNSREESSEPISSPLQSQTPVNEPTEPGISDANNVDNSGGGDNDGCGQEDEVTFEPLSAETDKPADEGISAADSALTLTTTSEPSLEGYYLDWSAPSVDNLTTSSNWESDLLFLIECFPDLEPNYLSTLLKMCKGSLEAAISTILVSHSQPPEEQSFMYLESQFSTDTTDDASSTISSASYTSQSHGFGGQQLDSSPEQRTTSAASQYNKVDPVPGDRQKPIFSIGDENDEKSDVIREPQLVPFFEEPECANDEEIARTLQEELDHEASSSDQQQQSNQEATTSAAGSAPSVGDRIAETAVEKRDRSSSHGSEDTHEPHPSAGDENLELRLSASLARQLQDMFGPVTDKLPFAVEIGDDDLVVLLSERAAHEIYKKWLDTLHAKRIGYRVQSEIDMTRDEALARRLQKEEDSKAGRHHQKKHHKFRHLTEPSSLAVMATEKYRAHHNSSPPQLKGTLSSSPQTGGGLTDIMGEQMAQQVQEAEVAQVVKEKSAPNLSLKLQLKNLYSQFPSLEQPLVNQTLVKNKFDVSSTVAELEQILLLPPPPPSLQRESIDGCGFSKAAKSPATKSTRSGVRGSGGTPAKRKLFKNEGKEQKHGGKGLPAVNQAFDEDQQLLYLELRAEAALHAKLRAESFMKAAHARSKKQYEVAQYYAQQGHLHTEKMKEANQRAAEATLKCNFTSSDQLDLHGLHVNEAITALEEKLGSCKGSKLRVVTGQGIHSKGGKGARIRPAVINYLQDKKYKIIFDEKNPGVLNVKLE